MDCLLRTWNKIMKINKTVKINNLKFILIFRKLKKCFKDFPTFDLFKKK